MFSRKKIPTVLLLSVAILAFVVSGCSSAVRAEPGPAANEISGFDELVDTLKAKGAQVEVGEPIQEPLFNATGQFIKVNGVDVQVFEFADEAARQAASGQISPDGSSTGTTMINWIDQPNFWAKGKLIVLYVGKDIEMIELLSSTLGEPITTHE